MLIWFTDGAINLGDGPDGALTTAAFDRLCDGGDQSTGLLQQFRSDQVVVFGVLLNDELDTEGQGAGVADRFVTVVEGVPDPEDKVGQDCGELSSTDVRGTVKVVGEVGDLAEVFDQLPLILAGGALGDVDPETGAFLIPEGVSRFVIQFAQRSEPWSLTVPDGTLIRQGDLDSPIGITVTKDTGSGSSTVDISLEQLNEPTRFTGSWTIVDHQPGDKLFRFSGLRVLVDDLNGENVGVISGEGSTITGKIVDRDGNPARLNQYDFDWVIQERLPGEVLARELPSTISNDGSARFTIDFGATSAQPGDQPKVDIALVNLRTKDGGVPLEGPIASPQLTVLSPDQVPSRLSIRFTDPAGSAAAPARGAIVAEAPVNGGTVALRVRDSVPVALSERFDREFVVQSSSPACEPGVTVCGEFGPTQTTVPLEIGIAPGEKLQYSSVTGELLVELVVPAEADDPSGESVRVFATVPFSLETERPINLGLLVTLLLILLVIGLALPVALAWVLKRGLVGMQHGRLLQRAEFPVILTDGALSLVDGDLSDEAAIASAFRNLAPNDQVRAHADAQLGTFAIRVPVQPLAPAWFSLTPRAGTRVIARHAAGAPRKLEGELSAGRLAATNGVLSQAWGVVIEESELATQDSTRDLPGTLVVYLQPERGDAGQYGRRLREILTTTDWRARVRAIAQSVTAVGAASTREVGAQTIRDEAPRPPTRGQSGQSAAAPSAEPPRPAGRPSAGLADPASPKRSMPPRSRGDEGSNPAPRPPGR